MNVRIEGTVAPGFEAVRELYTRNMQDLIELNTQLCVYHRGERVIDLWGSASGDEAFHADNLVNIFSSGKSLEALALAYLHEHHGLNYRAPVARYWPEFAAEGKADITVAALLRHECGLAAFDRSVSMEDLQPSRIHANSLGEVIERQAPRFRRSSPREYHALTRGWIANELFRRVDPAQRTIGTFLREEVNAKLGVRALVGLTDEELPERSPVVPLPMQQMISESLKPRGRRRVEHNLLQQMYRLGPVVASLRDRSATRRAPPIAEMRGLNAFNDPRMAQGETPSANTHSNARSLARIAAMLAGHGQLDGQSILGPAAWQALHGDVIEADTGFAYTRFSQGGVAAFGKLPPRPSPLDRGLNTGRAGFFGWMGLGGSIFQWHPEREIGFGYVPTSLNVLDFVNERGKAYQAEVIRCLDA
ncbi:MAG: serine hydrolase domain-containing protein [Pseudomonadota bacterium]